MASCLFPLVFVSEVSSLKKKEERKKKKEKFPPPPPEFVDNWFYIFILKIADNGYL